MLKKSTIQLLRFHFSYFLLPVFLFALSQVTEIAWHKTLVVFFILHILVYPASNGYNSYMDRDESPIGGIRNPLQPTKELFITTLIMDFLSVLFGLYISIIFSVGILAYILASRSYSYRGIRLKRFPFAGYLVVILFQGAVTFFLVYHGCSADAAINAPLPGLIASSLLIGGFYPLTQIYQHQEDKKDGVETISYRLGYRGTFVFTAIIYSLAMAVLYYYFEKAGKVQNFFILATVMLPVLVYFFSWARKVWKSSDAANFSNTMRMNLIASTCTNLAFIILIIGGQLE